MPSLSTAPSTSGELPLPASTPLNWICSKPNTSFSTTSPSLPSFSSPFLSTFFPLILLSPLYCVEVVLMNLPKLCRIYLFIYLLNFSQKPLSHKVKGSNNGILGHRDSSFPCSKILIPENRPDGGTRK